jgi:hypothetical protein
MIAVKLFGTSILLQKIAIMLQGTSIFLKRTAIKLKGMAIFLKVIAIKFERVYPPKTTLQGCEQKYGRSDCPNDNTKSITANS